MSDLVGSSLKLTKKRRKRDRSKTDTDVRTTLVTNCNKRPLDEINSTEENVKKRTVSATTSNEQKDSSILLIDEREASKSTTTTNESQRRRDQSVATFEASLPNELLFEIFKYLSQCDLLYAFLNLNRRFDLVLVPFTTHIDCSKMSIKHFEHIRNHLSHAQSLLINNQYAIKQVFRIDLNPNRFPLLERLSLVDPTIDELNLVFSKLKHMNVNRLNIRIQRPSSTTTTTIETTYKSCLQHHLFGLTQVKSLEHITIEMHNNDYLQFVSNSDILANCDHLRELTIPLRSFDSLLFLLEHVPNLRKLCVKLFADQTPLNVPLCAKPPIDLTDFELHVTGNELNFDRFALLMTSRIRAAKLERFAYFNRTTTDTNYFNGGRWEIFLENSFPRLRHLHFCFDMVIDEIQTPIAPILASFASLEIRWPVGHILWRPHSNKTRLKLFTLPYAFDTFKLSTSCILPRFNHVQQRFKSIKQIVLDATHGSSTEIGQQLIDLFGRHCSRTTTLQLQNIDLPHNDSFRSIRTDVSCHRLTNLIVNECDGRLFPLIFTLAPYLSTLSVTGYLLIKYFLKIPKPNSSYLTRIRTLEVNCMQIDRPSRLIRILSLLPSLFPCVKHLTIDINPKLAVDLHLIKIMLDDLIDLICLKIQRTDKYILDKSTQDDRQVRSYMEMYSMRLRHSETYEIVCKNSQMEIWL